MSRTPEQQNAIDVLNGWAETLERVRLKKTRRQAAKEIADVRDFLSREWPIAAALKWPIWDKLPQYPVTRGSDEHIADGGEAAVDIACPVGTVLKPIWTPLDSGVDFVLRGDCGLAADYWFTREGANYHVRYCHLSAPWRSGGDPADQPNAGLSTGPHLHMAIWVNEIRVRPEDLVWK